MNKLFTTALAIGLLSVPLRARNPQTPSLAKASAGPAEAKKPSIHIQVNLVNVLFTVTDKKHRLVTNLKQNDFRVYEDKKLQTIRFFSREANLPLRIGILIDTSNSVRERLHFEKEAAIDFLQDVLRPGKDRAFVVGFDAEAQIIQDYTDDLGRLASAIRSLQAGGATALYDAIYYACKQKMIFPPTEPYLRRVLIVISDGRDNQSEHTRDEALAMAQKTEATIYAISTDRSGLETPGDKVLTRLAAETGGRAYFPVEASDLAGAFARIALDLRSQYSLAYISTNTVRDGAFRTIKIVPRVKGLRVHAKPGYFALAQ
jgi:Ca-activated chloride channel family protein